MQTIQLQRSTKKNYRENMTKHKYLDAMPWEKYQQTHFEDAFTELDEWDNDRVKIIKSIIGGGKTVIDLGSGCGAIAEAIRKKGNNDILGEIKWFFAWRQFCFFPEFETVYNIGCLNFINRFIGHLMAERKKGR